MCRRFAPRCCGADFPCESKLSQIKSSPHHRPSGLLIPMVNELPLKIDTVLHT
jgi:hypothetical protein